jgi:hypothetical protein
MSKNQDLGELINGIKSLGTNQLNAPAYTSATSFTGTIAGYLGFDSIGNILTTGASSQWITSGSNIYYNTGSVGIGTSSPLNKFTVVGVSSFQLSEVNDIRLIINPTTSGINISSTYNLNGSYQALSFSTSDIERLRILTNGNVGIGTNSPSEKLHIVGNFRLGSGLSERIISDSSYIEMYNVGTGDMTFFNGYVTGAIRFITSNTQRISILSGGNVGIGVSSPAYKLDVSGDVNISGTFRVNGTPIGTGGGGISGSGTTNYISKWSAGTALTNSNLYEAGGKLSYATTTPFYQLDWKIKNNVQIGFGFGTVFSADDSAGLVAHGGGGISNTIPIGFAASIYLFYVGFTEAMRIDTSRNLLINTTGGVTGGGALQVNGDVNVTGTFRVNGVQYSTGGGGGISGGGTADFIPKFTGSASIGNSAMWDNGNFSINLGMTNFTGIGGQPQRYIAIYGPSSSGIILKGDTSDSQATSYINRTNGAGNLTIFDPREIYFLTGNATFLKLNGSGVGINTQPAGTPYVFVLPNDSLQSARAFAWYTYSDKRVKRDIEEISYGLNEVMQMKAVKYKHYSSVFENNSFTLQNSFKNEIGFVAQDMHKIVKEAVHSGNDSELWSLDKSKLIPVLVKAVQELKAELDLIKTNIA